MANDKKDELIENPALISWLDDTFSYHAPEGDQLERYARIRSKAKEFAAVVLANCPSSADRSAALRKVREAVMTANASIALKGKG